MAAATLNMCCAGSRFVRFPLQLAAMNTELLQARSFSNLCFQFCPLQLKKTIPPRRLVVRAARTESKVVSLGFRAPHFQVSIIFMGPLLYYLWFETWIWLCFGYGNHIVFGWIELASRASHWESLEIGRFWRVPSAAGKLPFANYNFSIVLQLISNWI